MAPGSVLAIMAHPDDAELWTGGTLALHALHAPVIVAVPAHDAMRDEEAIAGAAVLGTHLELIPRLDDAIVLSLIERHRPEVLITHPVHDVHPDHRATTHAVLAGLPDAHIATGMPQRLYSCDTYNSLTMDGPVDADVIVDITSTYPQKRRALAEHASQPIDDHFGPMAHTLSTLWGQRTGVARAEAFTAIPILGRLPGATHL
ncbi:PIG-L deacetylase family protein [Streptomyces sp. NPDC048172]|uniref:PIG-L deacetylase family protein n=1 Tax=Streptomyces sp. NPDC048172 TaxID=3365505 RepID=UPI003722BA7F